MPVFMSYSSRDTIPVEQLATTLRRAREEVWIDNELGGGDAWWRMILDQIRRCDVFVVALSQNMLASKACQAEMQYAQALGKPMLPVQVGPVDSMRTSPLAAMQVIDYQTPTIDTGVELIAALQARRAALQALPDPLPEEPAMPFAYLMRVGGLIAGPDLSPQQQMVIVTELKAGLDDDGDDATARRDISGLLRNLANRPDVTYRTRTEVESLLASLDVTTAPVVPTNVPAPQQVPEASLSGVRSRKGLLIGGGVATALIAVIIGVFIMRSGGAPSEENESATGSTSESTAGGADPGSQVDPGAPPALLLNAAEVGQIVGVPNIKGGSVYEFLDATKISMSDPDCVGASYNAMKSVYEGSGYSAVAQQNFQDKDFAYTWVNQAAVAFTSADTAQAFFDASALMWKACAGQKATINLDGNPQQWSYGDVTENEGEIAQVAKQEGAGEYACQHTLQVVSDTVIEVMACHDPIAEEAIQIADAIVAKAKSSG